MSSRPLFSGFFKQIGIEVANYQKDFLNTFNDSIMYNQLYTWNRHFGKPQTFQSYFRGIRDLETDAEFKPEYSFIYGRYKYHLFRNHLEYGKVYYDTKTHTWTEELDQHNIWGVSNILKFVTKTHILPQNIVRTIEWHLLQNI